MVKLQQILNPVNKITLSYKLIIDKLSAYHGSIHLAVEMLVAAEKKCSTIIITIACHFGNVLLTKSTQFEKHQNLLDKPNLLSQIFIDTLSQICIQFKLSTFSKVNKVNASMKAKEFIARTGSASCLFSLCCYFSNLSIFHLKQVLSFSS